MTKAEEIVLKEMPKISQFNKNRIAKMMSDFSSLQNKELIEENEVLKTVLLSSKVALKFMWDEMGKPHTPDHFNVPATL